MGSAAIRTKLALHGERLRVQRAHALLDARDSSRDGLDSAFDRLGAPRRGGGHLGHGRDEDLQLVAQPVDVRGQVGLRVRAGRHVLGALAHGGREHALHAWWGRRGAARGGASVRRWRVEAWRGRRTMMARERNGETASAARDGRSWNAANDAAVELPCESVSTLVAMVTGGRARARSDCWRRDETVCFSARASRGSVAFTSGFPRAPRSTPPAEKVSARNREPTSDRTLPDTGADFKRNETREKARYFCCTPWKGRLSCPPRFGRGSSPPTRRDGVEVGSETRDRGVRRGDARGVAAGNALARQGGVTANRYDAPA